MLHLHQRQLASNALLSSWILVVVCALITRYQALYTRAPYVRLDRVINDGYTSCRGLRIYSQALLWNSASCRRRVRALRSLSDLSLALSSNATTLNHLIRLRGSQGIQIWKQRTSLHITSTRMHYGSALRIVLRDASRIVELQKQQHSSSSTAAVVAATSRLRTKRTSVDAPVSLLFSFLRFRAI